MSRGRTVRWFEETAQDLRLACRLLARERSFALVAVTTLAVGMGANIAMFCVVETVLQQPLPYRDPDRLLWVTESDAAANEDLATISGLTLEAWRSRARSVEALSVLLTGDATLEREEPLQVRVACISQPLAPLFGVSPVLGRDFLSGELERAPAAPGLRRDPAVGFATGVAILSDRLYRRLGGERELLGETIAIGRVSYTVVGVLGPGFRLPVAPSLQLGVGLRTDADVVLGTAIAGAYRGPGAMLARLRAGVLVETARAELDGIRTAAARARQEDGVLSRLNVVPLHEHVVSAARPVLLVLWACVGFVLLVACANVVSLSLARALAREQEMAIRAALGAGRWRLWRQMITESLLLAFMGGVAGTGLAFAVVRILVRSTGAEVPRLQDAGIDASVLLFGAAVCAVSGIAMAVVPALGAGGSIGRRLQAGAPAAPGDLRVRRWHGALVVSELALALIPLTGAGLMLRSLWQVEREGGALVPGRVLVARVPPGGPSGQLTPADELRRTDRLLGEIEAIPGVRAAALWSVTFGYPARIQGLAPAGRNPTAMWFNVTSGYLAASGVSLLAGRWLTEGDRAASPPVVVVSERFARRFSAVLPDLDAIVGRTTFGPLVPAGSSAREAPVTIVGVVSDFRSGRLGILQPDASDALPQVFFPDALRPVAGGELLVRTSSSPLGMAPSIREVVSDRLGMRLTGVRTLDDQMSAAIAPRRFKSRLSVVFAAIALLLAAAGVSGVLRHAVARRTREIGVRVALGARASDIRRLFLAYAGGLVAVGVTLGLAGSVALSKVMAGILYGIGPFDPVAYAGVSLLLAAAALGAAYAPARRAMRLDPAVVLRHH